MILDDNEGYVEYDAADWTIWGALKDAHAFWWDIYCSYWSVNGRTRPDDLRALDNNWDLEFGLGARVPAMARTLSITAGEVSSEKVPLTASQQKELRNLLRQLGKHTVVRDRIALDLAEQALTRMTDAEQRAARLAGLVHGQALGDRASRYIVRCTDLYIAGFEVEAAIMSGAALEAALKDRCEEFFDPDAAPPTLDQLLEAVGRADLLDGFEEARNSIRGWRAQRDSLLWRADSLRLLRNYLVHEEPEWECNPTHITSAFEAIRELSLVLGGLFPPPTFK